MEYHLTGTETLLIIGGMIGLYFLIQFAESLVNRAAVLGRLQEPLQKGVSLLSLLFEPIVIITLSAVLVLFSPAFFGMILLVIFLLSFYQLRNYLSGLMLQLRDTLQPGQRLEFQTRKGTISDMGRLGLFLQTTEGKHFVNYTALLGEGYTLVSGQEMSGYYQLAVDTQASEQTEPTALLDLLMMAPYLDSQFRPELNRSEEQPGHYKVKVLLKDEIYLQELVALVQEHGYTCKPATDS